MDKITKIKELLENSPIDLDLKETIIENLSKMDDKSLDALIISLENEAKGVEILMKESEGFLKKQDEDWAELEIEQATLADKLVDEELKSIENDDKINALHTSLTSDSST